MIEFGGDGESSTHIPIKKNADSAKQPVPALSARPGVPSPPQPPKRVVPPLREQKASASVSEDEITIRTMRDDIEKAAASAAAPSRAVSTEHRTSSAVSTPPLAPSYPLPPKKVAGPEKVVLPPIQKQPRRSHRWVWVVIVILLLGGGGSGAAWYFLFRGESPLLQEVGPPAASAEVLPADALVIVRYLLGSSQQRAAHSTAWQQATGGQQGTSLPDLLAGNPQLLLNDPQLTELYYVLLEGEPRPYLVVPAAAGTDDLFSDTIEAQVLQHQGWYIVHPLNITPYQQALQAGSLAAANRGQALTDEDDRIMPLRILLGSTALTQVRRHIAGEQFAAGQLEELVLAGSFQPTGSTFAFAGEAVVKAVPAASLTADQTLLSIIPDDANLIRIGANFQEDLARFQEVSPLAGSRELASPAVTQLISELNGSYALYLRTGSDGVDDVGLIVEVPQTPQGRLALGDATLEAALPAVLPLVADRVSIPELAFADGVYSDIPLRYVNIRGQTVALDYAVTDTHLFVATSKEGMFALLDAATGTTPSASSGTRWQRVLSAWGTLPASQDVVLAEFAHPALALLPSASGQSTLPFGFATALVSGTVQVQGIVLLQTAR